VTFRVLSPEKNTLIKGNNASCVVLIESQHGRALLLGDAERSVEKRLVELTDIKLPVDVVIAGHHGSASSSSGEFIEFVKSEEVWFSAGYLNRYQFPKKVVLDRWQSAGVKAFRTDWDGTLQRDFTLEPSQTITYWPNARKPWHSSVSPLARIEHAVSSVSE